MCGTYRDPLDDQEARSLNLGDGVLGATLVPREQFSKVSRRERASGDGEQPEHPTGVASQRPLLRKQVVIEVAHAFAPRQDAEPEW